MRTKIFILTLLSTTVSLPTISGFQDMRRQGGYMPAFGFAPPSAPYQGAFGITPQQVMPPNRVGMNPSVESARRILARWQDIVDNNEENPDNITEPFDALKKDWVALNSALKILSSAGTPIQSINSYLLLRDLIKLAWIRQYTKTLNTVKQGYVLSLKYAQAENQRPPKTAKNNNTGAGERVNWYINKTNELRNLMAYFDPIVNKINTELGGTPPPLLIGMSESLDTAIRETLPMYEKMVRCLQNYTGQEAQDFKKELWAKYGKPGQQQQGQSLAQNYRQRQAVNEQEEEWNPDSVQEDEG